MKKPLKIAALTIGAIMLFLLIAAAALPFLIPKDKIKDFAAAWLSEIIKREVKIKEVSLNIFEGIKLNGLSIANHKEFSKEPFIKADTVKLSYAFWPLFQRKILIHEIALIKPEILIEKNEKGAFSFEDLTAGEKKNTNEKKNISVVTDKSKKKNEIDLLINSHTKDIGVGINNFKIEKGRFAYNDYLTGINELKEINLKISGITLALLKPLEIDAKAIASYLKKDIPLSVNAKVSIDKSFDQFSLPALFVQIAKESFSCPITIKNLKKGPDVEFNLSSTNLSLDTLAGIFAGQAPAPANKQKKITVDESIKSFSKSLPKDLSLKGSLTIRNAVFQKIKLDAFNANLSLAGKKLWLKLKDVSGYGGILAMDCRFNLNNLTYIIKPLNLSSFNSGLFLNDFIDSFAPNLLNLKYKAEGKLDASLNLSGEGLEMEEAFENAKIEGVVVLSDGRLKNVKALENIADKYNVPFLKQDILLKGLRVKGGLKKKVLSVESLDLKNTDLEVSFKGNLDFNSMQYKPGNRLTLKLSPSASKEFPKEFTVFKDDRGFVNIDFELQGSLATPIPSPRLERPIEKTIGKLKIKIEAKQIELEQKAKEEAQKEGDKLKKEAKEKIKEILKF